MRYDQSQYSQEPTFSLEAKSELSEWHQCICCLKLSMKIIKIKKNFFNPWHYSSEEPRLTEVVAARGQYRGPCGQQSTYPSTLISVFLTGFCYFSYQVATQLSSRGWVYPVPDPILPEKFLGYSRESNPGPLGWQSDMLTIIPNRRSLDIVHDCY